MSCHSGFLEEATRRIWYNPELILEDIGLKEGMVFADIGCGDGFFSLIAARLVGLSGKIYALDSNAAAVEKLRHKAAKHGIKNITVTVGKGEETVFCKQCIDIIFFSMVLHDFEEPEKVLLNSKQMLKPNGTVANLDWKKEGMSFGPPEHIRFSEAKASTLIRNAGFKIKNVKEAGLYHYIITAQI